MFCLTNTHITGFGQHAVAGCCHCFIDLEVPWAHGTTRRAGGRPPLGRGQLHLRENLFSHIGKSKDNKERKLVRPFMVIEDMLKSRDITNICLLPGLDNPADPLTISDRGVVGPLRALLSENKLRRIGKFEWLKPRG